MSRTAIGVFEPIEAERVLDELVREGFGTDGISVLSHDEAEKAEKEKTSGELPAASEGLFGAYAEYLVDLRGSHLRGIGTAVLAGPIAEKVEQGELPAEGKLVRECCGGIETAPERAFSRSGYVRDNLRSRWRDRFGDELCGQAREPSPATLLPRPDDTGHRSFVGDSCPSRDERKAAPGALEAPSNGPGDLISASRAERWLNQDERASTIAAETGALDPT